MSTRRSSFQTIQMGEVMEVARDVLGDAEIRSLLRAHLEDRWADCPDTGFIEELGLCRGRVRIDFAVVNGVLHGYEIKSDRDRLDRLPLQVEMYSRVVDRASVVVGSSHVEEASEIVPSWWGILEVTSGEGLGLVSLRPPRANPAQDPRALVELLWREEALALLEARQLARGVRGSPRSAIWDRVCEHLSLHEIAQAVHERLRTRPRISVPV